MTCTDARRARRAAIWLLTALFALLGTDVAAAAKAPALKLSKLSGAPATVAPGDAFTVSVTVKNPGKRKAKAQTVSVSLSKLKLNGSLKVKALKARTSATVKGKVTVPKTAAAGTYKLTACIGKACTTGATVAVKGTSAAPAPPARPSGDTVNLPPGPAPLPPDNPTATPTPGGPNPTPTPDPVVEDPKDAAPPLDPGAATSVYDSTKFLYTGANPIQRDVAPGAISDKQVAVLKGKVQDRVGEPIGGVRVTVLDHPELGETNTRADGQFDIAVNGGGITLSFVVAGFLPVQRTLAPNWQDYETLDDVVMVPVDPNVKTIDPDSAEPFQVVRGTTSSDKDGNRRGTLLFPKGVQGSMKLPNSTTKALDELKVRVTEFTYGDQGDEAMPGSLPANSGYTYAAEFSVDAALAAGATQVDFDKPLINYTENFIGAPVGSAVPTGYYDRTDGSWKGGNDGRVIKVVSEAGGIAGVDTDGNGQADTGLGITDDERKQIAALYEPGQELWRVLITHFTPWDHNWPYGPPPGARPPQLKEFEWKDPNDPCQQKGSAIGCETQTLQEAIPVTGTGMTLNYSTDRTPGWKVDETIQIPIVGPTVPPRLKGVQLTIDVGGEKIEKRWCDPNFPTTGASTCKDYPLITPNISMPFKWDGKDAYDRTVNGRVTATIQVIYVYEFNYYGADTDEWQSSFSQFGSDSQVFDGRYACGNVSGNMDTHFFCGVPVGQTITRAIGSWDARAANGLGGWSLSDHHAYDPVERALHRGDGATTRAEALPPVVVKVAGTTNTGVGSGRGGANYPKDGQLATEANVDYMGDYVRSPDGNLYLHNGLNRNDIFRISRDGKIYAFAGNGNKASEITGEGGPAKDASLGTISALAAAPDGALLIAGYSIDNYANTIRRVSPDGSKVVTIAGSATDRQRPLNDGKPALEAHLGQIYDMTTAPDGTIYWVERNGPTNGYKGRLRKLAPDGIVTTVAGAGTKTVGLTGIPAADVSLNGDPRGVAVGPDGSIYIAMGFEKLVIRIAPDGMATRFAGKGDRTERGKIATGGKANTSYIDTPYSIAAANDGTVYIRSLGNDVSPSASVILKIDEDGILRQAAGRMLGTCGAGRPDGESASSVCISNHSTTIGIDGDGGVTFADGRYLIRKVAPPLPGFDAEGLALPSSDGLEVYEFDRLGRHLRTRDGLTGVVTKTFEYDAAKRLVGVVDMNGNRTKIERDGAGVATAIVAPGGQRTALAINGGWLESVTDPAGKAHTLTYHAGGLLASFKKPEGGTTRFDYDADGRLTRHRGADGEERTLTRTEGEFGPTVAITTAGGKVTKYSMEVLANGDRRRTVQQPSGAKSTSVVGVDGITTLTEPDGTKTAVEYAADPRWGPQVQIVADKTVTTPSGKTTRTKRTDSVALSEPRNPFAINQLRTTFDIDGKQSSWTYANSQVTQRSAEGRETVQTLDAKGRVIKQTLGTGVNAIDYTYDALGRPKTMKQGSEQTTFAYDDKYRLASSTDAAGNAVSYVYDDADRVIEKRLPGNRVYKYAYDANGNVKSLTTPRGKVHTFGSTGDDRSKSYTPPGASAYDRTYSTERTLDATKLPSGATQANGFDAAGRLKSEDHVQTTRAFAYDGDLDRYDTATRTLAGGGGVQGITYKYDGIMPASLEFTGAAAGKYEYTIGDRILPTSEKLTVGATEITRALAFDGDRLATKTGPFTIERSGPAGAVSKITDGKLALTYAYDTNGRPATRTLSVNGTERFFQKLTFDNTGHATAREERVEGAADALAYTYDGSGQLRTVKRGATLLEDNAYDASGNRMGDGAAFDDRDRLTSRGGKAYTWDADGFLTGRGADTFSYSRDGELLSSTVGGTTTTYAYDAFGRRTAAGTTKYLYGNPANTFQVTATVAADGAVTTYYYDADDRLFAAERGGERYYVGTDAVGSPRLVVRASDGSVVRKVTYDSFGVETDVSGAFELPIGYAGGLRDAATGLVRFGARDYDPAAGRFTASDPTFFRGSAENLYTYAGNNPVTQRDPSGLACVGWSMYATFGGGIQFCRDNKLDWDADWSVCVEGGLGAGGGLDVDVMGGAADTGASAFAELTGKLGMVGGTVGGELDLGCMNAKAGAKVMYGWGTAGIDTTGSISVGGGQNDLPMPGARLEGKIGLKGCKKFAFI
ncbi:RHS repeat-associated core domain-containing protein [Solirubrobacter soli]|uniref:RHS repeat-associated core domain-containing protein n=1 Tax=Solirubrobacter soli TaxID=363832 RepID=UPI00042145C0|nr:RHS repeat-associated core domain-containing protein [Solirubrobacter soli]